MTVGREFAQSFSGPAPKIPKLRGVVSRNDPGAWAGSRAEAAGGMVRISVHDDGPGIGSRDVENRGHGVDSMRERAPRN